MARFSGDWEKEFRPQWEIAKLKEGKGLVGAMSNPKMKIVCTLLISILLIYFFLNFIFYIATIIIIYFRL